jgi:hypothetical protein
MSRNDSLNEGIMDTVPSLSEHQKSVLDFARKPFDTLYERDHEINSTFGLPSHVYFDQLNKAVAHPESTKYAPEVVAAVTALKKEQ